MPSPSILLTLLPLLTLLSPIEAIQHAKRHGAPHRRALDHKNQVRSTSSSSPRSFTLHTRADGSKCKVRPKVSAAVVQSSVSRVAQSTAQPVETTSSVYVAPPYSSAAPVWVEPTHEAPAPAPAPTTSAWHEPAPAPAPYVPPTNNGGGNVRKAGLAWPNGNSQDPSQWAGMMGASWYYTWSPWNEPSLSGLEFVPMLWGWKQTGDWAQNIHKYKDMGVKHALFANEPNGGGQANMSPQSGCELWTQQFEQLRTLVPGIRLGSAAPDGAPSGKQWLIEFRNICPQAKPDFYVLHWYDVTHQNFQNYVNDFSATFNAPLWVTEYACHNFNGGAQCDWNYVQNDFFHGTTGWMNSNPAVERYAEFGAMADLQGVAESNRLLYSGGSPTDLGRKYAASY